MSTSIGRSTAGKTLAQLESDGKVCRAKGERDGNRRLPDLWSLADDQSAANDKGIKATRSPARAAYIAFSL